MNGNQNHPVKGSTIKVEPFKSKAAIKRMKKIVADNPTYSALLCVGLNSAFRCSDILQFRVSQVKSLEAGGEIVIKEKKTGKLRRVNLNQVCITEIKRLIVEKKLEDDDLLFQGQRGPLTVSSVSRLVKKWAADCGLKGNYAAHSLRKTFGYAQRVWFNASLPVLVQAFGHSTQAQTLEYLCIQPEEIKDLYANEI
jgi:integrase